MFDDMQLSLDDLAAIADKMPEPLSRKYCLNFAYSTDYEINGKVIADRFDTDKFMCKITPIHNNNACRYNNIETVNGYESYYPYKQPEESLKEYGFDVLVFVPSMDEEKGLVTCGNAILGGSNLEREVEQVKIIGM
jgi:23S rRNA (adenine2503-C2)-methyltransferase